MANHLARVEVWVQTWLERLAATNPKYGFDVFTDMDFHHGIANLNGYRLIVLDSHPEYWTGAMRSALDRYLALGGHVVNISGDGLFDRLSIGIQGGIHARHGICLPTVRYRTGQMAAANVPFWVKPTKSYLAMPGWTAAAAPIPSSRRAPGLCRLSCALRPDLLRH